MPKFADLDQYFDPGLTLTVRGKEYVLPLPSAELGLWCRRVAEAAGAVHNATTQPEVEAAVARVNALPDLPGDLTLPERMLGDVYTQLVADEVPDPYITFAGNIAYVWVIAGEDAAEQYLVSGGRPEALRPTPANRAERRAQTRAGGTSTAAGSGTRSPASTSGTSTRRKSAASRKAPRSPGPKSSTGGGSSPRT